MKKQNPSLLQEFTPNSKNEWYNKATSDLKGKTVESLSSKFEGTLEAAPYYAKEDLEHLNYLQKYENILASKSTLDDEPREWINYQKIFIKNETEANKTAHEALKLGATGIIFYLTKKVEIGRAHV